MNDEPQPSDPVSDFHRGMNLLVFVANTWTIPIEIFIRRSMGSRYLGIQALAAIFLIPAYCIYWPGYDFAPIMWFLMAYLIIVPMVCMRAARNKVTHSYYNGVPRLLTARSRVSETRVKQLDEPFMVAFMGFICLPYNEPLGWYWIIGSFFLFLQASLSKRVRDIRQMDMRDAMIEQRSFAGTYHIRS